MNTPYLDLFLFAVLPYLAMVVFFFETIRRYNRQMYSYTSLSTQFLENKKHFWALMSFHYGILGTLAGHALAFLIPKTILWWNGEPLRLYVLEIVAFVFGAMALFGVGAIMCRRFTDPKIKAVTNKADWLIYCFLLVIAGTGIGVATLHGWGTSWFSATVSPYLWSLVKFSPKIQYVTTLPILFKLHMVSAFLLILVFPYTKLVHILVIPNQYMWRRKQVVRWNRSPQKTLS